MRTVRLGEIAENLPCDYGDDPVEGVPVFDVIKVSNVNGEGQFHGEFEKRRFRDDQLTNLLVKEGELLVVKSSGSKANILSGKTAICGADRAGRIVASNFLLRLRVDESAAVPRFIWYVLNNGASKAFVKTIVGASTYPNLKWSSYAAHPIPLPTLAEQRRIAKVLDRAEALRAKRRGTLAELDTLTQSIFLDLFGDPTTNPKSVSVEPLGNHLLFVTSGGRGWAEFYAPTGSRFIRSLDVQMNHIGGDNIAFVAAPHNAEARRTRVQAGDVLLTITGSRIGRVAPVAEDLEGSFISQHVAILRVDSKRIEPNFLSFFLSFEPGGQRQIAKAQYGQTKPGLNFDQIRRFQVPVPPISLQREFARRVEAVQKLKAAHRASLAELDALFASLQYRAFRGEL